MGSDEQLRFDTSAYYLEKQKIAEKRAAAATTEEDRRILTHVAELWSYMVEIRADQERAKSAPP